MSAPIRLQTHVWNPLGDRRALLLHGITSDGTCWWRLASELADAGWMVLAPDLRSHGRSPTAAAHDLATMADDVAMLGGGWDLLVGHSLGGALAAHLLARPALEVRAAVLIDPLLRLADADRAGLGDRLRREVGRIDPARIRAEEPSWDERDVQRKILAAALVTPDVVDAVLADNDVWDLRGLARSWRARVHLLAADPARGALLAVADAEDIAAADPELVSAGVVTGCGHSIQRERPGAVTDAVARVVTPPRTPSPGS